MVLAVYRDDAGLMFDCGGGYPKRHNGPPPQQPDEPGLVIARQPPITCRRIFRDAVQSEQIVFCPFQRGGLLAPLCEKSTAVGNGLLPVRHFYSVGAPSLQGSEGICQCRWGATKAT